MQKIVNVLAVASSVVSLAVVGSGVYVYVQRDQLIDNIKSQATEAIMGSLGGLGGTSLPDAGGLGGSLPTGANDLVPSDTPQAAGPAAPQAPSMTF